MLGQFTDVLLFINVFLFIYVFAFMLKMSLAGGRKVIQTLPTLAEHLDEASSYGVKA